MHKVLLRILTLAEMFFFKMQVKAVDVEKQK